MDQFHCSSNQNSYSDVQRTNRKAKRNPFPNKTLQEEAKESEIDILDTKEPQSTDNKFSATTEKI